MPGVIAHAARRDRLGCRSRRARRRGRRSRPATGVRRCRRPRPRAPRRAAPGRPGSPGSARRSPPDRPDAGWCRSRPRRRRRRPRRAATAFSTAPSSFTTVASMPSSARWLRSSPSYDVAMRLPARTETSPASARGTANRKAERANPSSSSTSDSLPESMQHVETGDAHVELARGDVGRDVARAQEEELRVVVRVLDDELARRVRGRIAGFAQHGAGGFGELTLVGQGDTEHVLLLGMRSGVRTGCATAARSRGDSGVCRSVAANVTAGALRGGGRRPRA